MLSGIFIVLASVAVFLAIYVGVSVVRGIRLTSADQGVQLPVAVFLLAFGAIGLIHAVSSSGGGSVVGASEIEASTRQRAISATLACGIVTAAYIAWSKRSLVPVALIIIGTAVAAYLLERVMDFGGSAR